MSHPPGRGQLGKCKVSKDRGFGFWRLCLPVLNVQGVQSPVGFWDPVGFSADGDVASFRRRRTVELKHGRIAMLACMGYMTPEITGKFPGYLSPSMDLKFADIPNGLDAIPVVPVAGVLGSSKESKCGQAR